MTIELLGNESYGGWTMETGALSKDSVVYSFGVGNDISWDLEMIKRFGCTVYAFDPDPDAIAYLHTIEVPKEFVFSPVGLATHDGFQRFYDPLKQWRVSRSTLKKGPRYTELPVKRLQTIMKELGHGSIDVLKMDIEGSEFSVIPSIADVPIKQILVEIHTSFYRHGLKGIRRIVGWLKTQWVFFSLRKYARLFVQDEDYTFVKRYGSAPDRSPTQTSRNAAGS
jgi:FkbM family methyltransferase